jgi:predicted GIY-YIG superfamily endonuclease
MTTYLIHFDQPYKHARHYLGCTRDLERRLQEHRAGRGSRLMEVVMAAGIGFTVARTWTEGDFEFEKLLKHQKHHSRLCPICHPGTALRRAVTHPVSD